MDRNHSENSAQAEEVHFLSEILGTRVTLNGKKIGKLSDVVIIESGKVPEVTHFYVSRSFGYPFLLIPWEKVGQIFPKEISVAIEDVSKYEAPHLPEDTRLLKDHILDKKVLDMDGREVEVVYDVRMVLVNKKLYVSDVDFSRYGFLRRMGLKSLANSLYSLAFMISARSLYSDRLKGLAKFVLGLANKIKDKKIPWTYIQHLPTDISSFKGDVKLNILKEKLSEMRPVDLADILEELPHQQRVAIFDQLDTQDASDILEEIDPNVQRELISSLSKEKVAQLLNEMTPGQAADILSVLPFLDANAIMHMLNKDNAVKIKSILERQEEKVINFSTLNFIRLTPDTTVAHAQNNYQQIAKGKDVIMYLYIINEQEKLMGVIDLKELLLANDDALLKDIMTENVITMAPDNTLKEAAALFARYDFRAIPIVDEIDRVLGIVPYRDIMKLKHRFLE